MSEIWRDIPGFDGDYQVSDHGRVRSLKFGKERVLQGGRVSGYPTVLLSKRGQKQKTHYVHRLVVEAFLPLDSTRTHVNHKDGGRTNNHVLNLERCTPGENYTHAVEQLGMKPIGRMPLLTPDQAMEVGELRRQNISTDAIASELGISRNTVLNYLHQYAPDTVVHVKLSDDDISHIFALRKSGFKLRQIAELYDVSTSHLSRVLNGNRRPDRKEQAS